MKLLLILSAFCLTLNGALLANCKHLEKKCAEVINEKAPEVKVKFDELKVIAKEKAEELKVSAAEKSVELKEEAKEKVLQTVEKL